MLSIAALSISRLPRIAIFLVIAFLFGISESTDEFFILYGIAAFFSSIVVFTSEIVRPSKSVWIWSSGSGIVLMVIAGIVLKAPLALLFIPLILSVSLAGSLTGIANRAKDYGTVVISTIAYLPGFVLLLTSEMWIVVIMLSCIELLRCIILRNHLETLISDEDDLDYASVAAGVLPGLVAITDRFLATTLEGGDVTRVTYAEGISSLLGTLLSYGLIITTLNGRSTDKLTVSLVAVIISLIAFLAWIGLALNLDLSNWTRDDLQNMILPIGLLLLVVPIRVLAAVIYPKIIAQKRYNTLAIASVIVVVVNLIASSILIIPFGVTGILIGTVIAGIAYTSYVWKAETISRPLPPEGSIPLEDIRKAVRKVQDESSL